ncbi:uncharacterized protein LOC132299285 [Cornus florida]|uniref:uncharacterized protein LOC132299285 n=1 Tax=Cornus florida TaxID=4283 RepID=UPI00289B7767|nr:uncharacterized protein LOC132299285 [Cornus florida]
MKASVKFRGDQKPILRAKVPLNILGFPFQSGIEAGDTKELCFNFTTFFESGPLLKLSYRPNDSWRPFGFSVRTGIGHFGSPIGAPMTMNAEFNFLANGNPSFFLRFRPQIGDFSIKRSVDSRTAPLPAQSSVSTPRFRPHANDGDSDNEEFFENNETPVKKGASGTVNRVLTGNMIGGFPAESVVERLCSGVEVYAKTALPLRDRAVLKLRWSVRFSADQAGDRTAENWLRKIPYLTLGKIGIEHVAVDIKQAQKLKLSKNAEVAESCLTVKRELDVLQVESGLLRKELNELRSVIDTGKHSPDAGKQKKDYQRVAEKVKDVNGTTGAGKSFNSPASKDSVR